MFIVTEYAALILCVPMEFCMKFDTVKSGWSIVCIEGLQVIILKKKTTFLSLKLDFALANR